MVDHSNTVTASLDDNPYPNNDMQYNHMQNNFILENKSASLSVKKDNKKLAKELTHLISHISNNSS